MKSIFQSKTFWLAAAQAIVGVIAIFETAYPGVGALLMAKSVADIALRMITYSEIK